MNSNIPGHNSFAQFGANGSLGADSLLPPTADFESLRRYTSFKLTIASQIRAVLDLLKKRGEESRVQQCESLLAKLAEDRFSIAVLGQFKRGKSSLLNAIIGRDLLPTGILPVTSVITILKFGPSEKLVIQRKGMQFVEHQPLDALSEFITQKHNPENSKGIETVAIELPLPFLRRGLEFVDTPGVGSAIKANTQTTYSFLPNCDAVLFVTSIDSPLSEAEVELLHSIRPFAGKIFFILNKIDLLADQNDAVEVVDFIKSRLKRELEVPDVNLIQLSAQQGLEAGLRHASSEFARSGLLNLQEALAQFLATERQTVFLKAVIDGIHRLLGRELSETELRDKAKQLPEAEWNRCFNSLNAEFQRLAVERAENLASVKKQLAKYFFEPKASELSYCLDAHRGLAIRQLDRFLATGSLRSANSLAQRYSARMSRRLELRITRWVGQNQEQLIHDINAIAKGTLDRLHLNLDELGTLPDRTFGMPVSRATTAAEELGPLLLKPKFDGAGLQNALWHPIIPPIFGFWPTFFVRSWVRNHLKTELLKFVSDKQSAALNLLWTKLDEPLQEISEKVSKHAMQLEERVITALSRRAPDQIDPGKDAPKDEKISAYRNSLQTLHRNFSSLREHVERSLKAAQDVALISVQPLPVPSAKAKPRRHLRVESPGAFATRGCPVCDHMVSLSMEFFSKFQYTLYNDEQKQQLFAEEGGFCRFHTWQLEAISSPVGFSVGCAKLIKRMSGLLAHMARAPETIDETFQQFQPKPENCRPCVMLREAEREYIKTLSSSLLQPEARKSYARCQGVCLRHLEMLIKDSSYAETREFLLLTASTIFQLISEDMESFALKREATRRHLVNEDEEDAYLRAVVHLAGAKHNCVPWTYRDEI